MRGSAPISGATSRSRGRRARVSGSSSTSTGSTPGPAATTSCAIRMPGSTTNVSRAVRVQQHDPQLAAVAGVDEPRRVDHRDPVLRGEARARLDEARVALGDRDGEAGADERRARPVRARRARTRRGRGPHRRHRPARHDRVVAQPADRELDHAVDAWCRRRLGSRRGRARSAASRAAAGARRRARPRSVSSRCSIGAPSA